jgi:uncharacterized protein DUF927
MDDEIRVFNNSNSAEFQALKAEIRQSRLAAINQSNIVQPEVAEIVQDDLPQTQSNPPNAGSQAPETNDADGQHPSAPTKSNDSNDQTGKNPRIKEVPARTRKRSRRKTASENEEENGSEVPHSGDPEKPWPSDEELPCYRVYDKPQDQASRIYLAGCYEHGFEGGGEDEEREPRRRYNRWLFPPQHVIANTTDSDDENYGLLLEFKSMRGGSKRYVLSRALLMGLDCTEAARILASMGLRIPAANRKDVIKYLDWVQPKIFWLSVPCTGWCPQPTCFLLPDRIIGKGEVCLETTTRNWPYRQRGTLEEWKQNVAAMAVGNSFLTVSLSAALVI